MSDNLLGPTVEIGFVDKRHSGGGKAGADSFTHLLTRYTMMTANAGGSTTTIVGANATPGTDTATTNVVRIGDTFRLFTSTGAVKEETVFRVTAIAVAGSTTVTYTPASAVATASGDIAKLVGMDSFEDNDSLDQALTKINATSYTPSRLTLMNTNDKVFALRNELEFGAL